MLPLVKSESAISFKMANADDTSKSSSKDVYSMFSEIQEYFSDDQETREVGYFVV